MGPDRPRFRIQERYCSILEVIKIEGHGVQLRSKTVMVGHVFLDFSMEVVGYNPHYLEQTFLFPVVKI